MHEPERVRRIELPSQPWEGRILPLNHTRNVLGGFLGSLFACPARDGRLRNGF